MNIKINRNSETAIYMQIKAAVKALIDSQELAPGYKMPSERKLAEELSVHRNTVVKAYGELTAEGYLYASRQAPKGYFVKATEEMQTFSGRFFPLEKMMKYDFNEREKIFLDLYEESRQPEILSLGGLLTEPTDHQVTQLEEIAAGMFRTDADETQRLKHNICTILSGENMYVNPKNIQIVSETTQALNYLMDLFLHEGDYILAEEPITPDNAFLFRHKGVNLVTVPMESDGMNMAALDILLRKYRPKFIYTLPNFHNPTGITMSLKKRMELLHIALQYGVPIIEEDSQREFCYTNSKLPSLYSLDKHSSVVHLYSFTLTFPYEIKTGYILGPYDLAERLGRCISVSENNVTKLSHYLLNEYIERGYFQSHQHWLAEHYKQRRDFFIGELEKIQDKGIYWQVPSGGLLLWCSLDEKIKEKQLYHLAKDRGLIVMPGFLFYPYGYHGCGHVRLCFGKGSDEEMCRGIEILGQCLDECIKERI